MKKNLLLILMLLTLGASGFAQSTLTVADGTTTNNYVPAYVYYFDDFTRSQFVIPSDSLIAMTGGIISSIKFYTTSSNIPYTSVSNVDVYLMEVGYTSISAFEPKSSATLVYQGTLTFESEGSGGSLTISLSSPYPYSGGNLLVGIENTTDAGYKNIYFYGKTVNGASIAGYNASSLNNVAATQRNFIPKTTFGYTSGGIGPMCFDPTGVTSSNVTTNSATISWNAPAAGDSPQGYQVCCLPSADAFDAATATWTAATGTSHTFTGLTAGTAYTAHVRSVCGTDFYSNGNAFTTFTTPFCNAADQCSYTFSLADDFGDGWNGASIRVMQGENQVETITLSSGSSNTVTVSLCPNVLISLVWNSGYYDNEASFTLTDPYGVQLYECTDGSTLTDGAIFYTGTTSCTPITCFPPTDLHASVTTNEATISWTNVSGNYVGYQAEWDGSVLPGLSGNPFSFTGLSPASTHTVRVRTVCAAGDTSNWSAPHTFTTDCPPYTTYPYIEGFEDVDIPTCWRSIDGDGDGEEWHTLSNPTDVSYSHAGDYHITSYSTTYSGSWLPLTPNNWLLSPPFTLPSPCNLSLVWYAKSQDPDYLEPLDILMSTTGSDTAAFTTTVLSLATVPGEYTQYIFPLANYAGQTVTFAFVHRNVEDMFRLNLDDVGVLEIPTVVTSDATNIDIYTASLNGSVTGQALTAIGFEWKASADSDYERDTVATGNHTGSISFNLANLDPATSYTFRTFAAVEGIIFYGDEKTFTTDQLPCPSPANLTVSNVDHESATVTWTSQLPTVGSYNVYLDNTLLNQTPVSALTYPLTGLTPGTSYEVTVAMVCNGTEGASDTKTFSTPCIREKFFAIGDTNSTQSEYFLPLNTYYNYSYTQQLFLASEMGSANLITNIAFNYAYTTSFTMQNVKIYMGHTTKDVFASNTDTVPFSALTEVYSGNLSFSPGWNTFELNQPFAYNGNDNLVLALFDNTSGYFGYSYKFLCAPAGANLAIDFYSDSQIPDPTNLSGYTSYNYVRTYRNVVKFGCCDNSTCVPPTVSVDNVTANDAEVTWTPGYQESAWGMQYKGRNDNDWTTVTLTPNSPNPYALSNLTSNTAYTLQMWSLCGNGELSDTAETTFTTLVSCPAPTSLAASNETADGATLTWTAVGTPSSFEVEYNDGENTFSTVVNANPTTTQQTTTLTGLSSITDYLVRVRAICGVGDTSTWSNMASFTTACAVFTAPYTEDFTGFNTLVSACWKRYSGAASSTTTSTSDLSPVSGGWIFNNQNVFGQGHAKLNIYGTIIKYWLVTPAIDISTLTNPELTFDLALTAFNSTNPVSSSTTQADDKFIVFISTDNGATWSMNNATVWDNAGGNYVYNNISSTGERISIPLSQYAGQTIRIAFYGESTVGSNGDNDVHIDNISVDERPSCPTPSGVTVSNVTATSATLTWTPGGNESAWDIYVPSSSADVPVATPNNMISVTATPYTVANLPSNSICTLYVRANCGNEESDWVSKTFTTPCGTVNIPYTEDFDSYSSSEYPTCWSRYPNTYSSSTNYPIINPNSAHSGSNSLYMYSYISSYYMAILPELNLDGMSMSDLWVTF